MFRTGTSGIVLGLLLGTAAVAAPVDVHEAGEPAPRVPAAAPERIELRVTGLSCPLCAYGLEKKLKKLEAVERVSVELKTGLVVLDLGDGAQLSDERLRAVVQEAGFAVTGIKRVAGRGGSPEPAPDRASPRASTGE
ncbi:MAG: heavy-metal-associated domain-containing protein [Gemmatimonadetes bacterium]|nr:heavy-metal-associated domain-containing protein [Gemmatimonadota bacterium]